MGGAAPTRTTLTSTLRFRLAQKLNTPKILSRPFTCSCISARQGQGCQLELSSTMMTRI